MDAEEKIRQLEKLLADPTEAMDSLTHFLLGREYLDAGRHEEGVIAFERCIELNPEYTAAYRFLGDCHRKAGNADKAREVYQIGIGVASRTGDLQAGKEMEALVKKV